MRPFILTLLLAPSIALAQLFDARTFTRADSLRGGWPPARSCYDVRFYHLDVRIDPAARSLAGATAMHFDVLTPTVLLQVDLFRNMSLDSVLLDGARACEFSREENAVFVTLPAMLAAGTRHVLTMRYHGIPTVARRPPWDGGFIWRTDSSGTPWAAVACQGTGASLWWPNKDHPADEPDSMLISVTVPPGLEDVSNGRLRAVTTLPDGWKRYDWFVSSPINNYGVTVNVGVFAHFQGHGAPEDTLTVDYYVKPRNLERARLQFQQVPRMLRAFEHYFGPYPFARDGFKLVESPHLGMEHQSCVAYGNGYVNGYAGMASSPEGLSFDFIIVHESAHEWWGNNITAADNADMWIHESFGAYAEALFVEFEQGKEASLRYINGKRQNVRNNAPMQGRYGLNDEGAGDMYDKGQLVLNTLRSAVDNDSLWFATLKETQQRFRNRTIGYDTLVGFFAARLGVWLSPVFSQYFQHARLPLLEAMVVRRGEETTLRYRWDAEVDSFAMPIQMFWGTAWHRLQPTRQWQTLTLGRDVDPASFRANEDLFYCATRINRTYVDPRLGAQRGQ